MQQKQKNNLEGVLRPFLARRKRKIRNTRKTLSLESLEPRQMLSAAPWLPMGNDQAAADEVAEAGDGFQSEVTAYVAPDLQSGADYFTHKSWSISDSAMAIQPDFMQPADDRSGSNPTPHPMPVPELLEAASKDQFEIKGNGMQGFTMEPDPGYVLEAGSKPLRPGRFTA